MAQARSDPSCSPTSACSTGTLTTENVASIGAGADHEVNAAVAFADAGTWECYPGISNADRLYPRIGAGTMKTTYRTAVHDAMRDALRDDPRVVTDGRGRRPLTAAPYAASKGLLEEFGPDRVRDTPLSELGFVGVGIGAAFERTCARSSKS